MASNHDLAIRWNNRTASVGQIKRAGWISIHAFPHHFRCPGGVVAVVGRNNEIKLTFKATAIKGPEKVTLADGKNWQKGYVIRADKRTIHQLTKSVQSPIRGWYAIGALRYYSAAKMRAILLDENLNPPGNYIEEATGETSGVLF